jgi:DNA-binding transcriptional LysR family regulator
MVAFAAHDLGVTIVPRTLARASAAQLAAVGQPCEVLGLTDPLAVHPVTAITEPTRLSVSARELLEMLTRAAKR